MIRFVNFKEYAAGLEKAVDYYYSKWGGELHRAFLADAAQHSATGDSGLPRFYLMLDDDRIIGCGALVTNDIISRNDLWPWLAGLYVEPDLRGRALGSKLMDFLQNEAARIGYDILYLTTDHDGYYEKYGWERMEDGYELDGRTTRIYRRKHVK